MIVPNNLKRRVMMRCYSSISPLELKDMLNNRAKPATDAKGYPFLHAGRRNPN